MRGSPRKGQQSEEPIKRGERKERNILGNQGEVQGRDGELELKMEREGRGGKRWPGRDSWGGGAKG